MIHDARLENWKWSTSRHGIFLVGAIFDDRKNRFRDGTRVRTSLVTRGKCREGEVVETMNTRYLLGKEKS